MLLDPKGGDYVQRESGLFVPAPVAQERRRPIGLDLFCGAGGFSLGMEQGGLDVIAACENDAEAAITYLYNLGAYPCQFYWLDETAEKRMERAIHKHLDLRGKKGIHVPWVSGGNRIMPQSRGCQHFFFGDVRNLRGADVLTALGIERGELDCVFGGPPCQGFSMAGRRNVMDPRNSLVFEFVRLVVELQPRTMALENVPGMLSMVTEEGLNVVEALCLALEAGGYGTLRALRSALGVDASAGRRAVIRESKKPDEAPTPKPTIKPAAQAAFAFAEP